MSLERDLEISFLEKYIIVDIFFLMVKYRFFRMERISAIIWLICYGKSVN